MLIESLDGEHAIGTVDSLLVCIWRGRTTTIAMNALSDAALKLAKRKGHIGMITVVEANAAMPESSVRADLSTLFNKLSTSVSCSALVFEGEGFKAAAVRGITTGINMVAKQPFPHKVFSSVNLGAKWMSDNPTFEMSNAEVEVQVGHLRASIDQRRAV